MFFFRWQNLRADGKNQEEEREENEQEEEEEGK